MPEGDQITETPPTDPAPEPTPDPAPEPPPAEPAGEPEGQGGPDLTDAISQLNAAREAFERTGEQPDPGFDRFLGQTPDPEFEDLDEPEPGEPGAQDPLEEARSLIREEFQQMLGPVLQEQEMDRRHEGVLALAEQIPQLREPEVMNAVDAAMRTIDPNYGLQGYVPDPKVLKLAYRAAQAELAESSTQGDGQPTPAEPGQHVETGAGPGAQPQEKGRIEQAYEDALAGGGPTDRFGFPIQQ